MYSISRDIEVEEYEEVVGHPESSPVLRRSSSAESVNDVSPFQDGNRRNVRTHLAAHP